jgi:hypothetical protein
VNFRYLKSEGKQKERAVTTIGSRDYRSLWNQRVVIRELNGRWEETGMTMGQSNHGVATD